MAWETFWRLLPFRKNRFLYSHARRLCGNIGRAGVQEQLDLMASERGEPFTGMI